MTEYAYDAAGNLIQTTEPGEAVYTYAYDAINRLTNISKRLDILRHSHTKDLAGIARLIQTSFSSWDEFTESYLSGYETWSGKSGKFRREIYDGLKTSAFNPYAIDWNLELKKSW